MPKTPTTDPAYLLGQDDIRQQIAQLYESDLTNHEVLERIRIIAHRPIIESALTEQERTQLLARVRDFHWMGKVLEGENLDLYLFGAENLASVRPNAQELVTRLEKLFSFKDTVGYAHEYYAAEQRLRKSLATYLKKRDANGIG